MLKRTTFRGMGYPIHVTAADTDGGATICRCSDVVLAIPQADTSKLPQSVLCPSCRRLLAERSENVQAELQPRSA